LTRNASTVPRLTASDCAVVDDRRLSVEFNQAPAAAFCGGFASIRDLLLSTAREDEFIDAGIPLGGTLTVIMI